MRKAEYRLPHFKSVVLAILLCLMQQVLAADEIADNPAVPRLGTAETIDQKKLSVRVALVDSGVNYLLPQINNHLARNANGNILGFDFWDMDPLPFDAHPDGRGGIQRHGTRTASLLLREAPFVSLIPYRYPRPDMSRMKHLITHAHEHGVRIIGIALGSNTAQHWEAFEAAARQYSDILFVASAGNNGRNIDTTPVFPASLDLPNMLVVTSADDFVRLAQGVNWGRNSVDYMVPAEMREVLLFSGERGRVSGSSYAVPRVVALAARILRDEPELDASGVIAKIRSQFADGVRPARIGQGYLHDPQFDPGQPVSIKATAGLPGKLSRSATETETDGSHDSATDGIDTVIVPLDILVLDAQWSDSEVQRILAQAQQIFAQCDVLLKSPAIRRVQLSDSDYLRDLDTGSSRTLMDAVRLSGQNRQLTVVLARDTRMSMPFDAEAFGRGNTRHRPWLTDSVWLTLALQDRGIALAHELFHVLVNSGEHSRSAGNLMLARTTGSNRALHASQCDLLRQRSIKLGLATN